MSGREKYDLTGEAYVLVLHHDAFERTARRNGSQVDMRTIAECFKQYRTELEEHRNLPLREVRRLMDQVRLKDFSRYSCVIVIVMSHGSYGDRIVAYDERHYALHEDVLEKVCANATLAGKPKLFIVNACRGNDLVSDAIEERAEDVPDAPQSDIIMFQSTYEGHVSYRNPALGSFFVNTFFQQLREHDRCHIGDLSMILSGLALTRRGCIQNPTMSSTLRKRLIFGDLRKGPPAAAAAAAK